MSSPADETTEEYYARMSGESLDLLACPSCGVLKPRREVAYTHAGSRGGGYYWEVLIARPCEECRARVSAGGSVGVLDPRKEAH